MKNLIKKVISITTSVLLITPCFTAFANPIKCSVCEEEIHSETPKYICDKCWADGIAGTSEYFANFPISRYCQSCRTGLDLEEENRAYTDGITKCHICHPFNCATCGKILDDEAYDQCIGSKISELLCVDCRPYICMDCGDKIEDDAQANLSHAQYGFELCADCMEDR